MRKHEKVPAGSAGTFLFAAGHGRNAQGRMLHYYLNFSDAEQSVSYPYREGADVLSNAAVRPGQTLKLRPWDLAIVVEQ